MASVFKRVIEKNLHRGVPNWMKSYDCIQYETIMGSAAYGVSNLESDVDIYGFCLPKKEIVFPHLAGVIQGFGNQGEIFEQWQQHHIQDNEARKEYDITIFNIVKYFSLLMQNNPNIIDSVFTPERCVINISSVGKMVRENRNIFLHKGCFHKFKGYAYSQLHKAKIKNPIPGSKREKDVKKFGFDSKFCYHVVRLVYECEQLLELGTVDLERDREHLKAIRRGETSFDDIESWFKSKEKNLEKLYENSTLPHSPDEGSIKKLLMQCLEEGYGNLSNITNLNSENQEFKNMVLEIRKIVNA